jgi:hypothetical protein
MILVAGVIAAARVALRDAERLRPCRAAGLALAAGFAAALVVALRIPALVPLRILLLCFTLPNPERGEHAARRNAREQPESLPA